MGSTGLGEGVSPHTRAPKLLARSTVANERCVLFPSQDKCGLDLEDVCYKHIRGCQTEFGVQRVMLRRTLTLRVNTYVCTRDARRSCTKTIHVGKKKLCYPSCVMGDVIVLDVMMVRKYTLSIPVEAQSVRSSRCSVTSRNESKCRQSLSSRKH